jgi:hypothetical protein
MFLPVLCKHVQRCFRHIKVPSHDTRPSNAATPLVCTVYADFLVTTRGRKEGRRWLHPLLSFVMRTEYVPYELSKHICLK